MVEVSVNTKQAIAVVWTLISIVVSLIVALSLGYPSSYSAWQMTIGVFFVLLLVMILPAYLLLALWNMLAKDSETG